MAGPQTGSSMYLYRNSGTIASPTWVLIDQIEDVGLTGLERNTADLKRRATSFIKAIAALIGVATLEFPLIHGLDATNFAALKTAFFAATAIHFAIADGPIATAGTEGFYFPGLITQFNWEQPLEEISKHTMSVKHTYMLNSTTEYDMNWFTISA